MCYAIPIFANRVAPRCIIAERFLFLTLRGKKVVSRKSTKFKGKTWVDLIRILDENGADILVCGAINRDFRDSIESRGIMIIDNVSCSGDEVQSALEHGDLHSGYGFSKGMVRRGTINDTDNGDLKTEKMPTKEDKPSTGLELSDLETMDCLACNDRVCLKGQICRPGLRKGMENGSSETGLMLESSLDIISERERTLCRLTELIYFCLEMKYKKIGIAFCIELFEQTEILTRLLRRFFEVFPVCCKIGGKWAFDPQTGQTGSRERSDFTNISCNPVGMANMLNQIETDINIIIGLCIGVDCVFAKSSNAPVSTLFVKDKALAHNPIGALYSDYYLKEIVGSSVGKT